MGKRNGRRTYWYFGKWQCNATQGHCAATSCLICCVPMFRCYHAPFIVVSPEIARMQPPGMSSDNRIRVVDERLVVNCCAILGRIPRRSFTHFFVPLGKLMLIVVCHGVRFWRAVVGVGSHPIVAVVEAKEKEPSSFYCGHQFVLGARSKRYTMAAMPSPFRRWLQERASSIPFRTGIWRWRSGARWHWRFGWELMGMFVPCRARKRTIAISSNYNERRKK